eukprot:scaffold104659_cov69-Phaeocystis_antarctica.AAC.6
MVGWGTPRGTAHLLFIVADAHEHVVQRLEVGASWAAVGNVYPVNAAALRDQVKEELVVRLVVLSRNGWHGQSLQLSTPPPEELVVGLEGVVLDQLGEVVRRLGRERVHAHDVPVVEERHRLRQRPVERAGVAAQRLHDEQVV